MIVHLRRLWPARPASARLLSCLLVLVLAAPLAAPSRPATAHSQDLRLMSLDARAGGPSLPTVLSPLDGRRVDGSVSAAEAREINARLPVATLRLEPAAPFRLAAASRLDRERALHCLTQAIYYEAGFQPEEGQRAVAQVVLNRVRHPAFPKSVCGVVFEGAQLSTCQFSFTCDGSLARPPAPAAWSRARRVAAQALAGYVEASVGSSTHYHADYVAPYWAPHLVKITQIGAHIFYRWTGAAGAHAAFVGRYAGREPAPLLLASARGEDATAGAAPTAAPDRHADNDVGGRITLGLGWTPTVPASSGSDSAYAQTVAEHGGERAPGDRS